jgi:F0F1-type ATP synthase delta subunit
MEKYYTISSQFVKKRLFTTTNDRILVLNTTHLTDDEIKKIVSVLKKENPKHVAYDMKLAPSWIREIMRNAITD